MKQLKLMDLIKEGLENFQPINLSTYNKHVTGVKNNEFTKKKYNIVSKEHLPELKKLPNYKGLVYRLSRIDLKGLQIGKTVSWPTFVFVVNKKMNILKYLGTDKNKYFQEMIIKSKTAKSLEFAYSDSKDEDWYKEYYEERKHEMVFLPNTPFKLIDIKNNIYYFEEV